MNQGQSLMSEENPEEELKPKVQSKDPVASGSEHSAEQIKFPIYVKYILALHFAFSEFTQLLLESNLLLNFVRHIEYITRFFEASVKSASF